MANKRLGVEYSISKFETRGTKDLPEPTSTPPTIEESINGVEEYRPDFKRDVNSSDVKPFIERVIDDVEEAWEGGVKLGEPPVDRKKVG